ncbi:DotU family type IV/VI secretion system protein, partial [Escherichia coli]|uniref:DotU family type IV/VI secretion system protein n=2 Tax=Enterobacterales TaxID=91347 RepID=UPI003CF98221
MSDQSLIQEIAEKKVSHKSYQLPLRGNNINPMIDTATPLLGMVIRMKSMSATPLSDKLFQQVVTDIQAIEQQLQTHGYEP